MGDGASRFYNALVSILQQNSIVSSRYQSNIYEIQDYMISYTLDFVNTLNMMDPHTDANPKVVGKILKVLSVTCTIDQIMELGIRNMQSKLHTDSKQATFVFISRNYKYGLTPLGELLRHC
jgi:hypothetical protein